ncbi:MAG: DUF2264 domain-containing protein [Anaerolineae bacterium]|nr:DUF2264 domain-containing protein [Anaerolineae bacterium]
MIKPGSRVVYLLVTSLIALTASCATMQQDGIGVVQSPVAPAWRTAWDESSMVDGPMPLAVAPAVDPTGVDRSDYITLAETVLAELLAGPFPCDQGAWVNKLYPQDPDLPSLFADGSEMFLAAANYMQATGHSQLNGCDLPSMMWNTFVSIDSLMPDNHYQTGISCAKLLWGLDALGGPIEMNPFWAPLTGEQRVQFRSWVLANDDWDPVANNMYLFRAAVRYYVYAWGWDDKLAEATADQVTFLDYVTPNGWLYDGSSSANDYAIYSVFGSFFNQRLNAARVENGDAPVQPEFSTQYTAAMLRYFFFAASHNGEPMPWSRSNGLYGLGAWIAMPEIALAGDGANGIERGIYKRAAHLYYLWARDFWYDGNTFNPYLDPTGVAPYENAFNGNGQILSSLLEAYVAAEESEGIAEVALPAEKMSYDLVYRFGDAADRTYGVQVANDLAGGVRGMQIEKPAYSSDWTPPKVEITEPITGSIVFSPTDLAWTASGVQFYRIDVDGIFQILTTTQNISLKLPLGGHLIEVVAVDSAWNLDTDKVFVRVLPLSFERRYLPLSFVTQER